MERVRGLPGLIEVGTALMESVAGSDLGKRISFPCHFGISTLTLMTPSAREVSSTLPPKTSRGMRPSSLRVIVAVTVSLP